jgi:hypothetical protein
VQLYISYRDDDASGFALSLSREIKRQAPDATIVSGRVEPGARAGAVPDGSIVLLIAGSRWLRSGTDGPSHFANASDPLRTLLESAMRRRVRIVPLVFQISLRQWESMCGQLPSSFQAISRLNAFEIRQEWFQRDIELLLARLRTPDREVPWTEAADRTVIHVEAEAGSLMKWWTGRDKALRVVADGTEVGSLIAFNGRFEATVEPGRHTVQIRQGRFFKSDPVVVEVTHGGTASLVAGRNGFTGALSLALKR